MIFEHFKQEIRVRLSSRLLVLAYRILLLLGMPCLEDREYGL